MKLKIPLIAVIIVFFSSIPSAADYKSDMETANNAYQQEDYLTALEYYRNAYRQKPGRKLADFIKKVNDIVINGTPDTGTETARILDPENRQNLITVNVLQLFFGSVGGSYHRMFMENLSAAVNLGYGKSYMLYDGVLDTGTGFYAGIDCEWQFENKALGGWFAGPGVKTCIGNFSHIDNTDIANPFTVSYTAIGYMIDLHIGYRAVFDGGFTVSVLIGTSYPLLPGAVSRLSLDSGYAF